MRLADFCNLHFKDEDPSCVRFLTRRPCQRALRFHVTLPASSDVSPHSMRLLATIQSDECRDSDAPVVEQWQVWGPTDLPDQDRFQCHLVKDGTFYSPKRLPPVSSLPQALCDLVAHATRKLETSIRTRWFPT